MRVLFFGDFIALRDGSAVESLQRQPSLQALLLFLVLHRDVPLARQRVAFTLWPDTAEARARANLRQGVYALRGMLGDQFPLHITPQTLTLSSAGALWTDVWAFDAGLGASDPAQIHHAIALYRGEILQGAYAEWLTPFRERYLRRYQEALEQLADLAETQGDIREAIALTRRLLASDPFCERSVRLLMQRLDRAGDRAAALACYADLKRSLAIDLGVEPALETTALAERISARGSVSTAYTDLPGYAAPFIGRQTELTMIQSLLADPMCRLITLIGLGGMGKTRLAVQAALANRTRFADSVHFIALSGESISLARAIASVLGVRLSGSSDLEDTVISHLRECTMLLVLDNPATSSDNTRFIARIVRQAPGVKAIVTSRERLHLEGEWLVPVDGLALPDEENDAFLSDAAQLFLQRARMIRPEFARAPEDVQHVIAICRMLGGIPLALEMAAAWAHSMTCADIASALSDPHALWEPFYRRRAGLWTMFDQSWNALGVSEQKALRRLALFRGGFSRASAGEVAGASIGTLATLADYSWIRCDDQGRYHMHDIVRRYLLGRLADSGDEAQVRQRYFDHMLALAEASEAAFGGPGEAAWIARIDADRENLHAALEWGLDQAEPEAVLRLGCALWRYWYARGYLREGSAWLERIATASDALLRAGSPTAPEKRQVRTLLAKALSRIGALLHGLGELARAQIYFEQSMAMRRSLDDAAGIAAVSTNLGLLAQDRGDYDAAVRWHQESVAFYRQSGRRTHLAAALNNLAIALFCQGDTRQAWSLHEESLALRRAAQHTRGEGLSLYNLGQIALAEGQPALAERLLLESLDMARVAGDRWTHAYVLLGLAQVQMAHHRLRTAALTMTECLPLIRDIGDHLALTRWIETLAELAALAGRAGDAARLLGSADAMRGAIGAPRPFFEQRNVEAVETLIANRLSLIDAATARQEGRLMGRAHHESFFTALLRLLESSCSD